MTLRIERTFPLAVFALFFCLHGAAFAQPLQPLSQIADEAFRRSELYTDYITDNLARLMPAEQARPADHEE